MSSRLASKVALVTGAGGGLGRESARLFAREGACVVCLDLKKEAAEETAHMVTKEGTGKAMALVGDVSKAPDMEAAVCRAEAEFGLLNVVFNNAGVMLSSDGGAVDASDDDWDVTMAVNVKGVLWGCKYGIPALLRAGGGSVINTASFVASRGSATPQLAYTASKGAVLAMTRELAVLHARDNIRVNSLSPGPLNTPLLQSFLDTDEKRRRRLVHVPMGRFGQPSEMAKAALFLASSDASYCTGTDLIVDGGLTAAYVTPETPHVDPFGGPPI